MPAMVCKLARGVQYQTREVHNEFGCYEGEIKMTESGTKISVEQLPGNRRFHVHKDDLGLGALTYVKPDDKGVEYHYVTSAATLCFIRGEGKIAINGGLVDYCGKWFEIPRFVEYQIRPETDTVMLTIQKPAEDADGDSIWRRDS
jgi:mannose-6-phosphate isomerase-like protein (cupin superfamily)